VADDMLKLNDYRDVSQVGIDPAKRDLLFEAQTEACVMWSTADGWPVGVMHRYLWHDDRFWITCAIQRVRVPALRRRPKSCVSISSEGTYLGGDINVVAKTTAVVYDVAEHPELKAWVYPMLAARQRRDDPQGQREFVRRIDTEGRAIIELIPQSWITYDGNRLEAALRGLPYDPSVRKPSRNLLLDPAQEG
jgi:hypothetical protein